MILPSSLARLRALRGSSSVAGRRPALRLAAALLALFPVAGTAAHAQSLYTFTGTTAVGAGTAPVPLSVAVTVAGTVAKAEVLTLGAPGQDFTESGSDACAGLSLGQSCSVSVTFSPKFPGQRNGAVVLVDGNNNILGTEYLTGVGAGSLGVMVPGTIGIAAGQLGQWTQVNDGNPATQADLDLPSSVALDGNGDLFIADSKHNRIREVLGVAKGTYAAGAMITVAGDGAAGPAADAADATKAPLNVPGGVAVDGAGNLYIADTNNNVVREVSPSGAITTVAGNGTPGYVDNTTATASELNSPEGVTVDSAGNLYIADTGNNAIRKVSGGQISTIAGDGTGQAGYSGDNGPATKALLNAPYGVAIDPAGNLYIPDSGNGVVRLVSASGTITTYAGDGSAGFSGDNGPATSAELNLPLGVALDPAGNLYIADARNYVVRKVSSASGHKISTVAGVGQDELYGDGKDGYLYGNSQTGDKFTGNGIATGAGIYAPYAVAVDPAGDLLIAEYFDHIIREVYASQATLFFTPELWENQVSSPEAQHIENDGNASLTFTGITWDANANFAQSGTTCTTSSALAVNAQCTIEAEFAPTTGGNPDVGNVIIATDARNTPLDIQTVGQSLTQNQVSVTLSSTPNPSNYGTAVSLSVTVAQGPSSTNGVPTGTVTFLDGTTQIGSPVKLNSSGMATLEDSTLTVGQHTITATYNGNTWYGTATSNPITQTVNEQVTISLANASGNNPSTIGTSVSFAATVNISGGLPLTGAVNFYDGTTSLGAAALNGSGVATFSTPALPIGSNSITATYTDVNNVAASSAPLTQMVEQQTAVSLSSSVNPSIHGNAVGITATVIATGSVAPGGTVTFYDSGTQIGTATLAAAGTAAAAATLNLSSLTAGAHNITASYGGDTNDFSSTSGVLIQTVNDASTSTALTAGANPDVAGTTLTLSATVSSNGSTPAGLVNFFSGGTLLGTATLDAKGVATFATSKFGVGSFSLTATYQGDSNNTTSTSAPLSLSVIQATTAVRLTLSAASLTVTSPVTFTATVSGNGGMPTGTVTFTDGTTTLGTGTVSSKGVATYTLSSLPVGQHAIMATYSGDADDAGSGSSAMPLTVAAFATQTQLAASGTTIDTDQQLTLLTTTSSASGKPATGTLTFVSGGTTLGSAPLGDNGTGTLTVSLKAGSYSIVAQYGGDSLNAPSNSSPITISVNQATEFTVQLTPASLSVPSGKYSTTAIALNSENGFADTLALGCSSLPENVSCNFSSNDVTLDGNGKATVQLTVDTNSPLMAGGQAKNEMPGPRSGLVAAFVFPGTALFGFVFWRFRRRIPAFRAVAVVIALTGATLLMNGCGGLSLNSAKAGSYVIQVTATGERTGVTHVANLTVQVTQ